MDEWANLDGNPREYYIREMESYVEIARKSKDYSIQRFDILAISVSGAGIYTAFELMKYIASSKLLTKGEITTLCLPFKVTALFFTLSIIFNFFSQWTAYRSLFLTIES